MIDNQFEVNKQIGKGGSSHVFSASDANGNDLAIKIIRKDKNYSTQKAEHFILRENFVMEKVGEHPNIVKSISCSTEGQIENDGEAMPIMYHALELCQNGSLNNYVKTTGCIEENVAKFHFLQIVSAIYHMHSKGFAHLDIKLDNILLDDFFNAKLADLGCAHCVINTNGLLDVKVGTPHYIPPEVADLQNGEYYNAMKADIYSLGVLLHVLLTGEYPNVSNDVENCNTDDSTSTKSDTSKTSDSNDTKWFDEQKSNQFLSQEATDLLSRMLTKNPEDRINIQEVACHPFLNGSQDEDLSVLVYQEFEARRNHMLKSLFNL